ncbi:hypothetical protein HYZ97_01325 [Candidatus Pacearchaeota archaeon]|nr:hypothetical protein [Candidatus Pacearchaeota archaeon]
MNLGYLGPKGTYTQEAAEDFVELLNLDNVRHLPFDSIEEVLAELYHKRIDAAVAPLRNSVTNEYTEMLAGLERYPLHVRASLDFPITLALGIHPESAASDVREIHSKDIAFKQCTRYLDKHYSSAQRISIFSTARAMEDIITKHQRNVAAIGSRRGIELYGLKLVHDGIGNSPDNFTTFLFLEA